MGSWDARGPWVRSLGRVGSTTLAALCLEVYYRYDRVLGERDDRAVIAPVASGTWRRSALPPHAAKFEDRDGKKVRVAKSGAVIEVKPEASEESES